ncbi:MAG: radical SAM protein [Alloprevotella sp.]|nr:radical SAM protein [Alloprevotella sp.]MBR1651988.1 radical SAM protein [Alloprevotella sp.]MBR1653303.1 radical SAM protein [Alloprevotella sp.]
MTAAYRINEVFYSLQGEGFFTGTPSLFIRFAGCNLQCPFCDTSHADARRMTLEEIVREAAQCPARHVVLTGGEPSLQADGVLVDELHALGKFVAVETNGTHALPKGIDWVTLSPKDAFVRHADIVLSRCDELKVVFDGTPPPPYSAIETSHRFLQPCDTGNAAQNQKILSAAVDFMKAHPQWRLSLQTHKFIGIR